MVAVVVNFGEAMMEWLKRLGLPATVRGLEGTDQAVRLIFQQPCGPAGPSELHWQPQHSQRLGRGVRLARTDGETANVCLGVAARLGGILTGVQGLAATF